jgi:hypothetical protein
MIMVHSFSVAWWLAMVLSVSEKALVEKDLARVFAQLFG